MRLLLRFDSTESLIRYLNEELSKLRTARGILEKAIGTSGYLEVVDINLNNEIRVDRVSAGEVRAIISEIDNKITAINKIINELSNLLGTNNANYKGTVFLEYENGYPSRVIITQPMVVSP
ncbi:hypothetical protein [Vulcanisaeta thermophila]|uniref:hypothetical protein n=1 Tax=Vulcanisaeta thermophila TaxID=867917 RepID=UPI00117CC888|nr:hypothetical protein [Vulcanisaeta thermophila]